MRKILLIIKREYLTRVRTKGFIIGTVIVPLIGVGSILLVVFLVGHTATQTSRIVIVDNSGQLGPAIAHGLDGKLADGEPQFTVEETVLRPQSPDALQQDLRARINGEKLDAYLWIPQDLDQPFELHMRNPDNFGLIGPLSRSVDQALISNRFERRGVHLEDLQAILKGTDLKLLKVSETGESVEKGQGIAIAIALVVLLYTSLLMYGIITMRSVIEEKTTRTMEVLISSVRPFRAACRENSRRGGCGFHPVLDLDDHHRAAFFLRRSRLLGPDAQFTARRRSCSNFAGALRRTFFHRRLFHVRFHVRRHRFRLLQRTGRPAIAMAGHGASRFLHDHLRRDSQ